MTDELTHLRDQFFLELAGSCEDLEQDFMRLEQNPDDDGTYKQLLREVHTIKGNAGLVGESALQSLCHSLENSLDHLKTDGKALAAAELGLRAVDILRDAAESRDTSAIADRIETLTESLDRAGQPENTDPDAARVQQSGPAIGLGQWKALIRAFTPVADAVQLLITEAPTQRVARRAGAAAVDLSESVVSAGAELRELAASLELTLQGITAMPKASLTETVGAFAPLLQSLRASIQDQMADLFRRSSFSVTVSVNNLSMLSALEQELRGRSSAPILILKMEVDYETLERDAKVYDSFWSLASMPDHTVAFLLPPNATVEKAAHFLREAIGTVPLVSSNEWETLRQIAHHNPTTQKDV